MDPAVQPRSRAIPENQGLTQADAAPVIAPVIAPCHAPRSTALCQPSILSRPAARFRNALPANPESTPPAEPIPAVISTCRARAPNRTPVLYVMPPVAVNNWV